MHVMISNVLELTHNLHSLTYNEATTHLFITLTYNEDIDGLAITRRPQCLSF